MLYKNCQNSVDVIFSMILLIEAFEFSSNKNKKKL